MKKKDHESVLNGLIILSWSAADTLQHKHLSGGKGVWP